MKKMSNFSNKLLLYNNRFLQTINRSVCQLNNYVRKEIVINREVNNSVPLATNSVRRHCRIVNFAQNRSYCAPAVDSNTFERVCEETLESLTDYFEELVENSPHLASADVSYSSGVLTVNFGSPYGTYVINRQSPNHQIWLSSPLSGPKRYDFVPGSNHWIYKHDNMTLHQLLQKEIKDIVKKDIDFSKCSYSLL